MFRGFLCLLCNLAALANPVTAVAQIDVLVTIKPLQLITEAIVGDAGTVSTLMPAGNSPHHYNLSPSDRIAIEDADLIIYVGEELETQFDSVMDQLASQKNILALLELQSIERHPLKTGDGNSASTDNPRFDPHIWLNTDNAIVIADTIRQEVSQLSRQHSGELTENFNRFSNRLNALENQWQQRLQSSPRGPYLVYHDAFSYFEKQFGLGHDLALVEDPEIQSGMRQIMTVRAAITDIKPSCLFTDDSANQATIDTMLSGYEINLVQLDLLGKRLAETESYEHLMENLVYDFINCF